MAEQAQQDGKMAKRSFVKSLPVQNFGQVFNLLRDVGIEPVHVISVLSVVAGLLKRELGIDLTNLLRPLKDQAENMSYEGNNNSGNNKNRNCSNGFKMLDSTSSAQDLVVKKEQPASDTSQTKRKFRLIRKLRGGSKK